MNYEEAKFILHAFRPNGADDRNGEFQAALEQVRADPVLGSWYGREQAHAARVSAKLREIAPPPGLRESILAGGHATERAARRSRWFPGQWLAFAAAIAVLASATALLWPGRGGAPDALTAFALQDAAHGPHIENGMPEKALETRLSTPGTHLSKDIQPDFTVLRRSGCRTLTIAGHDVLEICFARSGAEFHCYIGRAGDFPLARRGAVFVRSAGMTAATWSKGAYRFVVVGSAGINAVKQLL